MKKTRLNLFEYHFKIDTYMKKRLKSLSLYKKTGSLSMCIVRILKILAPKIEKEHLALEQRKSRYAYINEDTTIVRESIHVYLPEEIYMKLKLLHHNLNLYSIAQFLRMIINYFLESVDMYKEKVYAILLQAVRQWRKKRERRKYEYIPIPHLLHFIYQEPTKSRYLTIYNIKYSPVDIFQY